MTATYDDAAATAVSLEPVRLNENGRKVLALRYLSPDESPEQRFYAVARHVAGAERDDEQRSYWAARFYHRLARLEFLPNSPTLRNAGTAWGGCLSGCFVVPITDSMQGILDAHSQAAWIMKYGGGVGYDFSELRPRNAPIQSTQKGACGPVAVMRMLNQLSDTFTQGAGAFRVGAQMMILRVDHPDINEFIHCKDDGVSITHANVSVAITDAFMDALAGDGPDPVHPYSYELVHSGQAYGWQDARAVWQDIAQSAWRTGDPGLWFVDRSNGAANPLAHLTAIAATNPCGEQSLEAYGSCNLGSVDVSKFVTDHGQGSEFDWLSLAFCVADAVRFLDDVVTVNDLPTVETARVNVMSRRIGLGVMGWADALVALRIPYDSPAALELADRLMREVRQTADWASLTLGRERGPYGGYQGSRHEAAGLPYRNSFRLTMAPTGTISIIAGCSSGIEPHFSLEWERTTEDGTKLTEYHPAYKEWLETFVDAPVHQRPPHPDHLRTAMMIAPEWHIAHQAVFQRHVDNSISKTINMPESATVDDIKAAYLLSYADGCKGITIYRDNCRSVQVLVQKPRLATEPVVPAAQLDPLAPTLSAELAGAIGVAQDLVFLRETYSICPACDGPLIFREGCRECPSCFWSACSV